MEGKFATIFSATAGFVPLLNPSYLIYQVPIFVCLLLVFMYQGGLSGGKAALAAYLGQAVFMTFVGRELVTTGFFMARKVFPEYALLTGKA